MEKKLFFQLLEANRHEFFRFLKRSISDEENIDEIFINVTTTAYQRRHEFCTIDFRLRMYKILCSRYLRKGIHGIDQDFSSCGWTKDEHAKYQNILKNPQHFMENFRGDILHTLSNLHDLDRLCFLLLAMEKYSYTQIADILEITVEAVAMHAMRGRTMIKKSLIHHSSPTS